MAGELLEIRWCQNARGGQIPFVFGSPRFVLGFQAISLQQKRADGAPDFKGFLRFTTTKIILSSSGVLDFVGFPEQICMCGSHSLNTQPEVWRETRFSIDKEAFMTF